MNIHRAAYRWTSDELEMAMRRHMEAQIPTGIAWGVGVVLLAGAAISLFALFALLLDRVVGAPWAFFILPTLFVTWAVVLGSNALAIQKAGRQFAKNPGADQMIEWEISGKEVKFYQRGLFYTAAAWKNFVRVLEAEDGFLLYEHENNFNWLPFRAFESAGAIDEVREFVKSSGVPYKKASS